MQEFTGVEYVMIDIANNYGHGLSKKTWNERLDWFHENQNEMASLVKKAEEPALFQASIVALDHIRQGLPIGHTISLDATASGAQILSLLTNCHASASLCNVIDTGKREDFYKNIHKHMTGLLGKGINVDPDDVKQAVMTSLYGSQAVPKRVFSSEVLPVFYEAISQAAPGAWALNESLLAMWNPDAYMNSWVLPDNFHVQVKVMGMTTETIFFMDRPFEVPTRVNQPQEEGRSLGANVTHSVDGMIVREMNRRCNYNPIQIAKVRRLCGNVEEKRPQHLRVKDETVLTLWKHYEESGFLSTRILNLLDETNLGYVDQATIRNMLGTIPKKPFELLTNHDCFRCLPHYANDMRRQYNQIMHDIADSDLLAYMVNQIVNKPVTVNKMGDIADECLTADYALS